MGKSNHSETMLTSDLLHNRNCHAYLLQLKLAISQECIDLKASLFNSLDHVTEQYDQHYAYGDLYTYLLSTLEDDIDRLYIGASTKQSQALDKLILAIYHNNNHILGLEHAGWISNVHQQTRPTQTHTSSIITDKLTDNKLQVNAITPNAMSSIQHLTLSLFSSSFKPQLDTNVPSLKNYEYRENWGPTEYRFSTQAQLHHGKTRVSPLFIRWLTIKAAQSSANKSTCHIYFNNLGLDRSNFDIDGTKERALSLALHALNTSKHLKVAVITLPASQSLMGAEHYKITEDQLDYSSVFQEFYQIAAGNSHPSGITDFYINIEIRNQIFGANQSDIIRQLLINSFTAHGIHSSDTLSTAKKQAIWLHFTKFELTNYIIKKIEPDSYNFTCKEAIDRGTLSSQYYNLFQSFQTPKPMQNEEFVRALDAPAANVKGRGMNFHRKILWNALDSYVNANYDELIQNDKKAWLIFWRDMNCPHTQVNRLLGLRVAQCYKDISSLTSQQRKLRDVGLDLIGSIDIQHKEQISGQRLMLELVSRTSQVLINKLLTERDIHSYKKLTQELAIKQPNLQLIAGLAEMFLGLLLFLPSFGYSQKLIYNGLASAKASFFSSERERLCEYIEGFSTNATKSFLN